MSEEQIRNRNNSMNPMPDIRDNYYRNGPTPRMFNCVAVFNCVAIRRGRPLRLLPPSPPTLPRYDFSTIAPSEQALV